MSHINENTVSNPNPSPVTDPADIVSRADAAFRSRRAELEAVPDQELIAINLDPVRALTIVNGAVTDAGFLREKLAALPDFDAKLAAAALDYALCYRHTSARSITSGRISPAAQKLVDEATAQRDRFLLAVQFFINEGIIDATKLVRPKVLVGYVGLSEDLQRLATLLREHWGAIGGRTTITLEQVQRAVVLSEDIVFAVSETEQVTPVTPEVAALRQRAFTLMVRAYNELRRAVMFLRWYAGDADRIAPSLFAGRRSSKSGHPDPEPEAASVTPAAEGVGHDRDGSDSPRGNGDASGANGSDAPRGASGGDVIDTGSPFVS